MRLRNYIKIIAMRLQENWLHGVPWLESRVCFGELGVLFESQDLLESRNQVRSKNTCHDLDLS